ncbi:MAG: hypothetical protein A2148_12490 [Chloroflexi bacterium RBG_16_68_14]|nr:MAG: hypothetical protein A2148_12490 [Chloroflexi bacterium RBG_16_68_14]
MSSLATIRAAVRTDLHDEDATAYRWTDAVLARHINRALLEYSQVAPLEQKSTLSTVPTSRDISISTLTPRVRIVAVEFPTGEYPPAYVPFSLWGDTLTLDLTAAPSSAQNVNVYWHKVHSINGSVTFPASHDDIIAGGAAGYAALEWASFATNRLNVGGDEVWGRYVEFGNVRLAAFKEQLRRLPAVNRARTARLYTPVDVRFTSQSTDPGPQ